MICGILFLVHPIILSSLTQSGELLKELKNINVMARFQTVTVFIDSYNNSRGFFMLHNKLFLKVHGNRFSAIR